MFQLLPESIARGLKRGALVACALAGVAACTDSDAPASSHASGTAVPVEASAASSATDTAQTSSESSSDLSYDNPIVEQRADPWIYRTEAGHYYFIGTSPDFDQIALREADTINGLKVAQEKVIWRRPEEGAMGGHIWAPELHRIDGVWYIHVAAGKADEPFHIRMYVLSNASEDPMTGDWSVEGKIETPWDDFALDATTFEHRGTRYLVWAQRNPEKTNNSSLWMAEMDSPSSIKEPVIMLTQPELPWETVGYKVNEGAAVIKRHGKVFMTYSASATDRNYAVGLLWADADADLMNPASWRKSQSPVFYTNEELNRYGPGHNSFTVAEDGETDLLVYHARSYPDIKGTPLTDPNRHARVRVLRWTEDGMPDFGQNRPD